MNRNWLRQISTGLTTLALTAGLAGCGATPTQYAPSTMSGMLPGSAEDPIQVTHGGNNGTTRFLARNVIYRLDQHVSMTLEDMNADVILADPTLPFIPANKTQYSLLIHHAIVHKDAISLQSLMNTYVFVGDNSPLRNIQIQFQGNQIVMSGQMKKVIWVSFKMTGNITPTKDGMLQLTPTSMSSEGLPVGGLVDLIGLGTVMQSMSDKGVTVVGNNIVMDPAKLYPPPTLHGKVVQANIANNMLNLVFDDGQAQPWPAQGMAYPNAQSTVLMWGGDVLINTCLCLNAKIQEMDGDGLNKQMVFALDLYRQQLQGGFIVGDMAGHLTAFVPDMSAYDTSMQTFQPVSFPIPGEVQLPSDMGQPGTAASPGPTAMHQN